MYLYALRAQWTSFVKIGISIDPAARIKRIRTDCPHDVRFIFCTKVDRAYDIEQWMHAQLTHRQMHGEWFRVWRDASVHKLFRKAQELQKHGELPKAVPQWRRLRPVLPPRFVRNPETTQQIWQQLPNNRTRRQMIELLVYSGWDVGQIRSVIKGDNGAIGVEVEAAKQRLGIVETPRMLRVKDDGGERLIPMEA